MTADNRRVLLNVVADLRKIIRQGASSDWQLRSLADTIADVVKEEKDEAVHQQAEG